MPDDVVPSPAADRPLRRWPPIAAGALVVAGWLVAAGWRVRRSLELVLTEPSEMRVCPLSYPAPAECFPEAHLQIAAAAAGAVLLAYGLVVLAALRGGRRGLVVGALVALVVVGLVGYALVDEPGRYLTAWG